jgi:hypothetical protein
MPRDGSDEVYVEFIVQNAVVKATAIDAKTGMEASIVVQRYAPRDGLRAAAVRKLLYVLKKKQSN